MSHFADHLNRSLLIALAFACWFAPTPKSSAGVLFSVDQSAVAGTTTQEVADKKLRPAIEAFKAGKLEEYKTAYQAAAKAVSGLPAIEIFTTKLQIESGRQGDAIVNLDRYLSTSPNDPEGYLALGEIAFRSKRLTDAAVLLAHAQKLCDQGNLPESRNPSVLPGLMALRAQVAEQRQLWDEADDLYQQSIALRKGRPQLVWKRGRMLVLKGSVDQGVRVMAEACATESKLPSPELTTALILSEKRNNADAQKWFQAAIKADRNDPSRWSEYLKWLLSNGRSTDARKMIDKLTPNLRQKRSILMLDGLCARFLGDFETAEAIFSKLHQSNQKDLEAADQLAIVLAESKDEAKRGRAMQLSQANLRQSPGVENTIATAAWVQFKLGSVDVADRMLAQLASKIAISPQTAYYISQVMKAKGNVDGSRNILQLAIDTPGLFAERTDAIAELSSGQKAPSNE